jgi:hypothetical protein
VLPVADGEPLAIGSVLIIRSTAVSDEVASVVATARALPWLPVVIEDSAEDRGELQLARMLLPRAVLLSDMSSAKSLRDALCTRPYGVKDLMEYLRVRVKRQDCLGILSAALEEYPWQRLGICRTAYYRLHRDASIEAPSTWRLLLTLAPHAGRYQSIEKTALSIGRDPRTVSSILRQTLQVSNQFFRDTIGWEWVVEIGLRRLGIALIDTLPFRMRGCDAS